MKRNRLSVIRSSDSDRTVILEQHSYPSVSSIRITHLHRHLVQHDRVITAHYHLQFIESLYRGRNTSLRNTEFSSEKGADGNRPDNERGGTAEKRTERKMDEKSRSIRIRYRYYSLEIMSVHETMTFSTVFLSSAAISARS